MSLRKLLLCFCITFILCGGAAYGQEELPSQPEQEKAAAQKLIPLGLRQAVARALVANLDIAVFQYNPDIRDAELLSTKGEFDPVITLNYLYSDEEIPQTSRGGLATGAASTETVTDDVNASLSGKIISGTEYEFFFDRERSQFTRRGVFDPGTGQFITQEDPWQYVLDLYVNLTQPLLKDFGLEANLAGIRIARAQRSISIEDFRQQVIDIISQVQTAYWNLVLTIENLRVTEGSLAIAQDLLRENRIRLKVGTISPLDVVEAEAGVAQREEEVIVSESAIRAAEDNLKQLLNLPKNTEDWDLHIVPTDKPVIVERTTDLERELQLALENRPDYKSSLIQIESSTINERFAKNQLLPSVDLTGQYEFRSVDNKFQSAFDDIEKGSFPSWNLGLSAEYPIGNRTAKGNYRVAQLERLQSERVAQNLRLSIIVEVRKAIRDIETSLKSVEASRKTTEFAKESLDAERKKQAVGISTSHDVLLFVEDLVDAQRREVLAITNYRKALVSLSAATGTLLKENNIAIDERFE